jgi:hypothetical protein
MTTPEMIGDTLDFSITIKNIPKKQFEIFKKDAIAISRKRGKDFNVGTIEQVEFLDFMQTEAGFELFCKMLSTSFAALLLKSWLKSQH